ncbi:tetratricopeptide repeat protein [Virgibacillus sp. MSP4-1]|uniref:tetratricopeptide repeat protein n=1 Tax=Virgibacillus sp. MSP4-1 TaxID=2700081 RepID=UPI0003A3FB2C|nr:tetratricopeptide repeat protein [Virgibacillus sp. MSP4-1]QHS24216.1 tetratricopeptide repeat protein [Virgibacillus sp. MSP4-1]
MEINIKNRLEQLKESTNTEFINDIVYDFEQEDYENLIRSVETAKQELEFDGEDIYTLNLLEILGYIELNQMTEAEKAIKSIYSKYEEDGVKLHLLGQLAYEVDLKLARKFLSRSLKLFETDSSGVSSIDKARAYLLLAETEEQLSKIPRALKYYDKGLESLSEGEDVNDYLASFLHFKKGMLLAARQEYEQSVESLKMGIDRAGENLDIKIHLLVSLGKIYVSMENYDDGLPYLQEAKTILEEQSSDFETLLAETLTELAYYDYQQEQYSQALANYRRAIQLYEKENKVEPRKLGMIYMQYAHCLESIESPDNKKAGGYYEKGIECLEQVDNGELLENALADVIKFFEKTKNNKKIKKYEQKVVNLLNNRSGAVR